MKVYIKFTSNRRYETKQIKAKIEHNSLEGRKAAASAAKEQWLASEWG